jgi:signal transduction histidine kinase
MESVQPSHGLSPGTQVAVLQEQLAQAQRLTALGELASTTAHEFNNVLTTIINYAKIGLRHKDEATRDKAFERILAAGQRAARITNGVLGLARHRAEAREPTDVRKLLEDVLFLLEREMQKYRIRVETQLEPVPPALVCPHQIQQVILNLLINARQAMPHGGRIILRTALDDESRMIDLMVRDTGSGIPPDKLPKIFDRFYSTKQGPDATGRGGTGLGLSMCRDVIEAHQGRIRVESTVGKGTAFTLKLPVAPPRSRSPGLAVLSAPGTTSAEAVSELPPSN